MINGEYHYNGVDKDGYAIIIDIADLTGYGNYEVMAMRNNGAEIACECFHTLDEAVKSYNAMIDRYTLKNGENPPLKGKYAKLKDDYAKAIAVGLEAAMFENDGGTCNFDSPMLFLPRWNEKLIEQAANEAGGGCYSIKRTGGKCYIMDTPPVGQANRNTVAARAMAKYLASCGYQASVYYQMD